MMNFLYTQTLHMFATFRISCSFLSDLKGRTFSVTIQPPISQYSENTTERGQIHSHSLEDCFAFHTFTVHTVFPTPGAHCNKHFIVQSCIGYIILQDKKDHTGPYPCITFQDKDIKQAGAELCQAQHSLSLDRN